MNHLLTNTTILTFICLLQLMSCKTSKPNQDGVQTSDTLKTYVLKFNRGPCFGKCPVYSFYLLSDHTALIHAKANFLDTAGWYFKQPDQESIAEILELIEPIEWWIQDLNDQPEIVDLPSTTLIYNHPQGVRTITIQSRTNQQLDNVFEKLSHLVSDGRWKATQLRPLEIPSPEKTDVIVQLKEGVEINTWMKKFDRFGIHLKKRLTPNQQYYLVAKDPDKGNANDFLQYIKIDPDVIEAQWDMELSERK